MAERAGDLQTAASIIGGASVEASRHDLPRVYVSFTRGEVMALVSALAVSSNAEPAQPTRKLDASVSQQITRLLGTDDWAILHSGHEMVTDVELDGIEAGR